MRWLPKIMIKQTGKCRLHPGVCLGKVCRIRYANGSHDHHCERCRKPIRWALDLCAGCNAERH